MTGITQNGQKCLNFIAVPLLRLENIKVRWKRNKKLYYSKYKQYK